MRQLKSLIVALALVAGPALAGPFQDGWVAFQRQDYEAALRLWRPFAMEGDAGAQLNLGLMYADGHGVAKDDQQAVLWFRKAAEQGNATAQFNLGVMFNNGRGVPIDNEQAVYWYRKAAEQGRADAQNNLGRSYANGRGVPQDDWQAVHWYRKAAEQGHARAQYNLGASYASGRGVQQDDQQAVLWLRKASEQGDASAQSNLAVAYRDGRGVAKDNQQAVYWLRKAAAQGDVIAQYNLGAMYGSGRGVQQDDQRAYFWSLLASIGGDKGAVRNRDILERRLTADQIATAQADARIWKPQLSKAPDVAPSLPPPGNVSGVVPSAPAPAKVPGVVPSLPQPDRETQADSTGSGFRVVAGRIVTNNHVVEKCSRIRVNGDLAARVLARDARNDLAIVAAAEDRGPAASVRATRSRLGEEVAIAGFPLHGMLSGLSVTKGNVSRLSGLAGDSRLLQISAPVQPGNSGGPLLDAGANVIGVVVSKLDALRVAKATGDIPQNVNFALNANVLRAFLDANDVEYADGTSVRPLSPTEVASRAARFTVLVECWN